MRTNDIIGSKRRWRVFYKHITQLVYQFLPTISVMLMVYLMANFAVKGVDVFPHQYGLSITYRVLCMTLSFGWFLFLLSASLALGFCNLHRVQIVYIYLCSLFVWIHRWWTLGAAVPYLAWFATILGSYLLMVVIYSLIIKRICRRVRLLKTLRKNGGNNT